MNVSSNSERIYYLDAMRGILMTLGVVLHSAAIFSPLPWAIQNAETPMLYGDIVSVIKLFRMPAFFIVSGIFCHMTLCKLGHNEFLKIRLPRIIIPLVVTALTLNSLQNIALSSYFQTNETLFSSAYWLEGKWVAHLWFLNCLIYYFIFSSCLYGYFDQFIIKTYSLFSILFKNTNFMLIIVLPLLSMALLKISYYFSIDGNLTYDLSISDAIKYCGYFIFGIILGSNKGFRKEFTTFRPKTIFLIILTCLFIKALEFQLQIESTVFSTYVKCILTWLACHLCFIIFHQILNFKSSVISYFSEASYSIYVFHHLFVICYGILVINLSIPIWMKFTSVVIATFITTTLIHHFFILKVPVLRYLYNGKRAYK